MRVNLTRKTKLIFNNMTVKWPDSEINSNVPVYSVQKCENNAGNILWGMNVVETMKQVAETAYMTDFNYVLYSIKYLILIGQSMQSE